MEYNFYAKDYALATRPAQRARYAPRAAKFERAVNTRLRSGAAERFQAMDRSRREAGLPPLDFAPAAPDVRALLAPETDVGERIASIRDALIKTYLGSRFAPDSTRGELLAAKSDLVGSPDHGFADVFSLPRAPLEVGTVVGRAVALRRGTGHSILAYAYAPSAPEERAAEVG